MFRLAGKSTGVANSVNDGCITVRCVSSGVVCFLSSAVKKQTFIVFMTNTVDQFIDALLWYNIEYSGNM